MFKHTAIYEMIDLIEHKCPWKRETREKVMAISQQVIDDLSPFKSGMDPNWKKISDTINDLRTVIGIIDTPVFQVVASYEALSLLMTIAETLQLWDFDIDLQNDKLDDPLSVNFYCNFIQVRHSSSNLLWRNRTERSRAEIRFAFQDDPID